MIRQLLRRGALPQEAEDAIQEAFIRLRLAERKAPIRNPNALLTTISGRVWIEQWRILRRRERLIAPEPVEELDIRDPAVAPEESLDAERHLERIWRRLDSINPRTREAFRLHRIEGLTYSEIAMRLRISVSAVEKHIARAAFVIAAERDEDCPQRSRTIV